jgi:predicted metal-dependent HD superfamily phosphohydrolase
VKIQGFFNKNDIMIKETFTNLLVKYSVQNELIAKLWTEIETHYSARNRHYHTLVHLEKLLQQLTFVKNEIQDWDTILFSLFYHDVVYNALKSDNEEKSAALAVQRMKQLSIAISQIETCQQQILATKSHLFSNQNDTNYFTDADLSILGQPWKIYEIYTKQVRKEYAIFPSFVYNPGRKKVLIHFLNMENIYKTDFFYQKFELQAKKNLQSELDFLNK